MDKLETMIKGIKSKFTKKIDNEKMEEIDNEKMEEMDKMETMIKEIKSKITKNMISNFQSVQLEYKDIRLDIIINNHNDGHINLSAFSRGHHVRENPEHRIMHRPSNIDEPASDKGDGSLFLALVVRHCNEVFKRPVPYWIGGVTEWWRIKGVCSIQNACNKTERSGTAYEIDNKFFMEWSDKIILDYNRSLLGGKKLRKKKSRKKRKTFRMNNNKKTFRMNNNKKTFRMNNNKKTFRKKW